MNNDSSASEPLRLHAFFSHRPRFVSGADEAKDHDQHHLQERPLSCWWRRLLSTTLWSNIIIWIKLVLRFVELRLALHNSLISLVELTDHCTLRHPAHALYHSRSPYVPMLTAVALYHVIRDGVAWTLGGLLVALVVGNMCINVYYKTVRGSFKMLGLPLPAPAIHCDILPEQQNLSPTPPPPPPPLTSLGVATTRSPFFGSETMTNHQHQTHQTRHDRFSFTRAFDRDEDYVLTSTSSSSSGSMGSPDYDYSDGGDDSSTACTLSTVADNVQTVFGKVLQEIREKVEVCHEQDTMVDSSFSL